MLIAHWTFDLDTLDGRKVAVAAGAAPDIELGETAEVVPGRDGGALALHGHDRAVVPAVPQLVLSQVFGFSVAFFVQVTEEPTGEWRSLVYKPVAENDARGLGLWLYPDAMRVRVQLFTVKGPDYVDSRTRLPVGEWVHIALVVDTAGMSLYINGKQDVGLSLEHAVVTPAGPVYLGSELTKPGFGGLLDDFRVYATALDDDAIRALAAG
ncbi:LamG domain-containing protein [Actinomadura darangshiensis]|uniref:LamG domain-containing protein n=1 Tax=Actinomadura darangshiensis TaxID=705336 RepID=A0A4R5AAI1_9ACTN|nr:LamG domain-containing protein [Actinomadura darangshiensis]TDD66762.1 LamG domain-containing protein [Actinomadura darangshiensis]